MDFSDRVNELPSRIYSRLDLPKVLEIYDTFESERFKGELSKALRFHDFGIGFGYLEEPNKIVTKISSPVHFNLNGTHLNRLEELLKNPSNVTINPPAPKSVRGYKVALYQGKIVCPFDLEDNVTLVEFGLKKNVKDPEKVFDSFWYHFRPILKIIQEVATGR